MEIIRLSAQHAEAVTECFRRAYGSSYANRLFYDSDALAAAMDDGTVSAVGALRPGGEVVAHMAMTRVHADAPYPELGNTVVDPSERGSGMAWQVGEQLTAWCRELGYTGFLHYPTTDHHIMQRQSVKRGFETGLMLGYIPAETDGKVVDVARTQRGAATIVFEPFVPSQPHISSYLPTAFEDLCKRFASACDIPRDWPPATAAPTVAESTVTIREQPGRGLTRLEARQIGEDFHTLATHFVSRADPCQHLDLCMDDPALNHGVAIGLQQGFVFCGWLPGFRSCDVLRLQRFDLERTDLAPAVINPTAQALLHSISAAV